VPPQACACCQSAPVREGLTSSAVAILPLTVLLICLLCRRCGASQARRCLLGLRPGMWAHTFSQCLGRDQADLPRARMHSPWFELLHARPGAPLRLRQERGTSAFSPGKGHHCVCARKGAPLRLRQERGTTASVPCRWCPQPAWK